MNKSYKFRIYPNSIQLNMIEQTLGNSRFVYNYYLDKRIKLYQDSKESFNYYKCANDLTNLKKSYDWLKLSDSIALQESLKNLENAYQKFFKEHSGFPNFKSKKSNRQSYTTRNCSIYDDKYLKIPKLGLVRCKFSRIVEGKILNCTISKNPSCKYFISICCDVARPEPLPKTGSVIGIDLGIKDFCIDSNGNKFENPKYLAKSSKKLKKLQRQLSRKTIGSKNRDKARIKVALCHEKITNQRMDYQQKLSTKLIQENDIICLESLKVKNMIRNHKLAKSISDCSWSEFINMLCYKAEWYDKKIIQIDTFYPSSKTCNCCGYIKEDMDLSIREWICPECNTKHDRDVNAAINILNKGLKLK